MHWYPSKVDWWLAVLLGVAPVMMFVGVVATLLTGDGIVAALGGMGLLVAIYLGLVFPMRYGIVDDTLVIRHGLVRQRVPLRDISEVRPTTNPLSSPALSLDRLNIRFGEGVFKAVMISPKDKQGFMTELSAKAGLHRQGEHWVRA